MNAVHLIGRLTRDPETKYTQGGTQLCNFSLALDIGTKAKPKTAFVECTAWEKTAQLIEEYVAKGHRIGVTGRLDFDQWEDKETGKKRTKLFVVVDRIDLLQARSDDDQRPTGKRELSYGEEPQVSELPATDDVPF